MTDGRYPRPEKDEPGISRVMYYKDASPIVVSDEGRCGSRWFVGECPQEEWKSMLAGVHVAGGGTPGDSLLLNAVTPVLGMPLVSVFRRPDFVGVMTAE